MLVAALGALLVLSVLYNVKLHKRLRAYEHVWMQIERVADHNEDGTFTINIQHLEHMNGNEAHLNTDQSGIHLLDLEDEMGYTNHTDGPPRAA